MTRAETLRSAARRARLSGSEAAEVVGVSPRTWRRYIGGDKPIPAAVVEWFLTATGQHPEYDSRSAMAQHIAKSLRLGHAGHPLQSALSAADWIESKYVKGRKDHEGIPIRSSGRR